MKRFFLFLLVCFVLAFNLPAESTDPAPDSTPDPAAVRLQYAQTMKDLKFLGDFIVGYVMDNGKAPGEKTLDDLLKMDVGNGLSFADFYMDEVKENEVPLKDAWGNVFIYKYKGAEFWLASPGSDGEFKGFKQKGFYLFQPKVTDGMDIIFSNAGFTLFPTDREDLTRFILGPFVKVVTLLKLIFL